MVKTNIPASDRDKAEVVEALMGLQDFTRAGKKKANA